MWAIAFKAMFGAVAASLVGSSASALTRAMLKALALRNSTLAVSRRSGTCIDAFSSVLQIQSDRNISFDKKPNMQSEKIAEAAVAALKSGKYNQARTPLKTELTAVILRPWDNGAAR